MSTSYKMPTITIRFIRTGEDTTKDDDDVLSIRYSHMHGPHTMVNCLFAPGQMSKKTGHEFVDSMENVIEYLALTFKLLRRDSDPYDSIQADIPAYPSLLFSVSTFKPSTQRLVLKALASVMMDWPCTVDLCKDNSRGRYFATSDCMDVDDE